MLESVSSSPNAPLRLFILGIGRDVSSDVCEGLANVGGGQYLLAVSEENIVSKCMSLLGAGRTSTITDVRVDWTAEIFPRPLVQQSPPELPSPKMYPSTRSIFFAIIHSEAVPKQVVVSGKVDGKDVSIRVDVESTKFGRKLSEPPLIHTLAANRLIRDLEDGTRKGKQSETAQRREVVRLGEHYQLASLHTSFVAVDYGQVHPRPPIQQRSSTLPATVTSLVGTIWQYLADPTALFRSPAADLPRQGRNDRVPGGWATSASEDSGVPSESESTEYSDKSDDYDDWASDNTFSTLSSFNSYSSVDTRKARRPRRSDPTSRRTRALSPQVPYAPPQASSPATNRTERFKPLPIDPHVTALVEQMSASGSFTLTDALGAIVGKEALEEARSWEDEELAATALAMAYLEKNLGDHLEMCQLLKEKGMEFVRNHPNGGKFGEMLDRARGIV